MEQILHDEIGRLQDYHAQEAKLWQEIKMHYKVRAQGHTTKINNLKTALEELNSKIEMGAERIRTLLHSHRDKFRCQLKEAMERGWTNWAKLAAELHTFCMDQEKGLKCYPDKGSVIVENDRFGSLESGLK